MLILQHDDTPYNIPVVKQLLLETMYPILEEALHP